MKEAAAESWNQHIDLDHRVLHLRRLKNGTAERVLRAELLRLQQPSVWPMVVALASQFGYDGLVSDSSAFNQSEQIVHSG
jgi:hypothetical protein